MMPQTPNRDVDVWRGHARDYFAPVLVLGWILTLALFGIKHETRWGKLVLPSWGGWRWIANKILAHLKVREEENAA